ncbi:MAG: DUF2961 domain-containing protein, partial [Thermoguttaceae bacterium]|nr:DUF2961 domain-containing protein [Thermoguttaceae bacterium]
MKKFRLLCLFTLTGFILAVSVPLQAQTVSLRTLLDRLTETPAFVQRDNDQAALFAAPKFTCKQASSYDRAAVSPTENWFANADTAQFIRQEKNDGRDEWVLIDAEGPGAIVRWWITAPHYKNNFRIYIDGNPEPVITGNIADIVGGEQLTTAPLSSPRAGGRDLYLPIPYAKNIKITCDNLPEQGNLYYQINYLTFEPGTEVESFSLEQLNSCADQLKQVNQILLARTPESGTRFSSLLKQVNQPLSAQTVSAQDQPERTVLPGKTWNCGCMLSGGIQEFCLALKAEDMACATRNTIICLSFDEEETVWCPVSEFFGTGVGVNPYKTWFTEVKPTTDSGFARFTSFWTMPFKKNAKITILNLGK